MFDDKVYRNYLEENTSLAYSTIDTYIRIIKEYYKKYKEVDEIYIRKFISKSIRENKSYHKKYAIKHYLKFIGKEEIYKTIPKIKVRGREKLGTYLPKDKIKQIIFNIKHHKYRDIAYLQYLTGARAFEIISLKSKNIIINDEEKYIRIMIVGKGSKTRITFLDYKYKNLLLQYMGDEYLFFWVMGYTKKENQVEAMHIIHNMRNELYKFLNRSGEEFGVRTLGTHDLRRNFAEEIRKKTKDIYVVKKLLGHSCIETTLRYFNDNPENIKDIITKHQE